MRLASITIVLTLGVLAIVMTAQASTPAAMSIDIPYGGNVEPVVSWDAVKEADHYDLSATFLIVRNSATGVQCARPLVEEQRTIEVDETLPAGTTSFTIELPVLPPEDQWAFFESRASIEAFDAEGAVIAAGNANVILESSAIPCPTQTPGPILPDTGSGPSMRSSFAALVLAAVLALSGLALVAAARVRQP